MLSIWTKNKYNHYHFNCIDFVMEFVEQLIDRPWPEYEWPKELKDMIDQRIEDVAKKVAESTN
jgi:hypothetical protein